MGKSHAITNVDFSNGDYWGLYFESFYFATRLLLSVRWVVFPTVLVRRLKPTPGNLALLRKSV